MQCPRCGGDNPDDYKFCIHCGSPREQVITLEGINHVSSSGYQDTPRAGSESEANLEPKPKKPSQALFTKKWFIIALIIVPLLCCFLVFAIVLLLLVKTGAITFGNQGDHILLGVPNRSSQIDLYLLSIGEEVREGKLLVEDISTSNIYLNYFQDGDPHPVGNYYQNFGGFIPEQKLLVFWYKDEDGNVYIQRQALNQDSPTSIYDGKDINGYGQVLNEGRDIFFKVDINDEERCYVSLNGETAQRITIGDSCFTTQSGAYVLTTHLEGDETTLTIMNLDGSGEVTIIDSQKDIKGFRVAYDGTRLAYVTGLEQQQLIILDSFDAEVIALSEPFFQILDYGFADNSYNLFYIAENNEGKLDLYLMDDSDSVFITTGISLQAAISQDGDYVIYAIGDENQEYTVYSYDVNRNQSTHILQGKNLRISLANRLERVFINQRDDDELTIYSASQNGRDLVNLYNEHNTAHGILAVHPNQSGVFIYTYSNDNEVSIFFTPPDENSGYYLFRKFTTLEIKDISSDGDWLLTVSREYLRDDRALTLVRLQPDQTPLILDESEYNFTTAVFSANSKEVIYTALTGNNSDDCEVRQVSIDDEPAPVTIYDEAQLVDVQWTQMHQFSTILFLDPLESTSFCPGAPIISPSSVMEGTLTETGVVCYRFHSHAGQLFTINIEAEEFDATLELYDRDGYLLDWDDDSGPGVNPRLVASLPEEGNYYLKISAYGGGTGHFALSMQEGIGDASKAIPLDSNVLTRDYINSNDAIYLESTDYSTYGVLFYFDGIANEQIRIDVFADSQGSEIDPFIYLYDASMDVLMTDDDSGVGYDARIVYTLPLQGRYYILVEDLGGSYGPESKFWFDILLSR